MTIINCICYGLWNLFDHHMVIWRQKWADIPFDLKAWHIILVVTGLVNYFYANLWGADALNCFNQNKTAPCDYHVHQMFITTQTLHEYSPCNHYDVFLDLVVWCCEYHRCYKFVIMCCSGCHHNRLKSTYVSFIHVQLYDCCLAMIKDVNMVHPPAHILHEVYISANVLKPHGGQFKST